MTAADKPEARKPHDPALGLRIASAAILAPVALFLVWSGGTPFTAFVAAFAAAMGWEWLRMADREASTRAFAVCATACAGAILFAGQGQILWAAAWTAAGAIGVGFSGSTPLRTRWRAPFGILYVAGSAGALVLLRNGEGGREAIIFLLCVVWAADSLAYLAGTWLGGPKLLPKASPNKTWTGLIAGLAAGAAAGAGVAWLTGGPVLALTAFALGLAAASVAGDLAMSLFKRGFGVKDSGTMIPGHGGVLDRVDALMLAALAALGAALAWEVWP